MGLICIIRLTMILSLEQLWLFVYQLCEVVFDVLFFYPFTLVEHRNICWLRICRNLLLLFQRWLLLAMQFSCRACGLCCDSEHSGQLFSDLAPYLWRKLNFLVWHEIQLLLKLRSLFQSAMYVVVKRARSWTINFDARHFHSLT